MLRTSCLVVLVVVASAPAQKRSHDITPADYATLATITELAMSADGKHIAYCEGRWDAADDSRKSDLWLVPTDGSAKPTRLTADRANDRHPRWSADGTAVYVLANRKRAGETKPPFDGSTQVWQVRIDGSDPRPITRVEGGVTGYDYAPTTEAVFYTKDTTATDDDAFTPLRSRFKADYGHGTRTVTEVWRLDLRSWRAEKIVAENRYVREFAATRDGQRIALVTAIDDTVVKSEGESRVDVWEGGQVVTPATDVYRAKAASPHAWLEGLAWNHDGTRFAFNAVFDAYPAEIILGERTEGRWATRRMPRPAGRQVQGYGSPLRWNEFGGLIYHTDSVGTIAPAGFSPESDETTPPNPAWAGQVVYATERGGRLTAVVAGGPDRFPDVHVLGTGDTVPRRITDVNPHTRTWKFPTVRHVTWASADGTTVGGVLELPHGYKPGERLPLVVAIHGGPTTASYADLRFDPHNGRLYFAANGYAVLLPNYRGSTGYGDKFLTDLVGHENNRDVQDIIAGIQHLVKDGIADPNRVGVMGWSNGGYLTNCLITRKDSPVKIRAASSGAGILDTVAEWGFNDEPAYPRVFKTGLPWEVPDVYRRTSPTYDLGNVTTPTLIHVGGNDVRCPPGHSRMLYRAMREYLHVPAELVVYPNEPHGLTKLSHRRAKMEWDLAWFEKYLLGKK